MSNLDLVNPEESVILIVDDLKQNLKLLNIILESAHYQTSLALSGKDALERLKVLNPDLILLDLMMPDINGLEVCRRIKSSPEYEDIPVIFLTASVEENHLIEAYSLGANDYVNKPFRKPELLARIKTQLTLRKQSKLIQELLEKIECLQNSQHNK